MNKTLFQKGNPGGPGRPRIAKVNYRKVFEKCVSQSDFEAIVLRAVADAKAGGTSARNWLFSHLIAPVPRTVKIESPEEQTTDSRRLLDSLIAAVDNVTLLRVLEASRPKRIVDATANPTTQEN